MTSKEQFGCVLTIARLITTTPLYYILMYLILKHINATELIWILFWIYAPLGLILVVLFEVGNQFINPKEK